MENKVKINKKEMADQIADEFRITKKFAVEIVDYLFDFMGDELRKGNSINITGFGRFDCVTRNKTTKIIPTTKEVIEVPEKKSVTFKPCKIYKKTLNPQSND